LPSVSTRWPCNAIRNWTRQFERWLIGHTLELAQAGIDLNDLAQARRYGAPLAAAATAMFDHWSADPPETR
jgi:GMP synthase (glutamine-hydrolysing)